MSNSVNASNGSEVYETAVHEYLDQYLQEHPDIEDMHKEPQSRWNAAMLYIQRNFFKPNAGMLKADTYKSNIPNSPSMVNYNAYNEDVINRICDIYISLCFEYDKEVSVIGFSNLTGVAIETIYGWNSDRGARPGTSCSDVYKKLSMFREESLSDRLYSGRSNPVGILGILNRHYGWNMGQPRGNTQAQTQSIESIQERYKSIGASPAADDAHRISMQTPDDIE